MKVTGFLLTNVFVFLLAVLSNLAIAIDSIDAEDFVDEASAKGIAEIEAGKLALQKSTSADIKAFAQMLIDDHTAANSALADIALRKKLEMSTDAELLNKAKAFVLKQRDGESFDEAFAKHQVKAHEYTILLFKRAIISKDADLAAFAANTLPKLEQHLHAAKSLVRTHTKD